MRFSVVIFLCLSSFTNLSAQDYTWTAGLKASLTRMDYFVGPRIQLTKGRYETDLSIAFGAQRTFEQHRIFPRMALSAGYAIINRPKFGFLPLVKVAYSLLNLRTSVDNFHQWEEIYGGLRTKFGNKWIVHIDITGGWINEHYKDSFNGMTRNEGNLGYDFEIGIGYAW